MLSKRQRNGEKELLGLITIRVCVHVHMCVSACMCAQLLSCFRLFMTPWIEARVSPLSMEFSKQEYWGGFPFSLPGASPKIINSCSWTFQSYGPKKLSFANCHFEFLFIFVTTTNHTLK